MKAIRLSRGLTQSELAVRMGQKPSAVAGIENEGRSLRYGTMQRVAAALGVRIVDLLPESYE